MLTIIGLVGAKGAGKNTVAKLVREAYPQVREGALADRLKDVCAKQFDVRRSAFDDADKKERYINNFRERFIGTYSSIYIDIHHVAMLLDEYRLPITEDHVDRVKHKAIFTPRQLAQYVGTEVLRALDPDVHCKALMENQPKDGVLIVTDIRFPNELEYFEKLPDVNFVGIFVQNLKAEAVAAKDTHASESHLRELEAVCEYRLFNDDTSLEDLKSQALHLLTAHVGVDL